MPSIAMATSSTTLLSSLVAGSTPSINSRNQQVLLLQNRSLNKSASLRKRASFVIKAAKPPAGLEFPKVEPQFEAPLIGFTKTAEIWNSRACMIGIIGVFIVEFIINKGVLQVIGVDVGKGLNLPL
ncbi:light-harvesting complex-like protein OHP1, chloroplastic [Abrus precatorius]|uniref:Light-harvesting complex-like protein OHP1, chloroplastic n=1 Tax=Abrus precatorius TaxID=3816 RepID=A0A8B8L1X2_ABRPR|nr:light-harvesting complex-like protein OHP1, chloroplastic [Abrus precatorius]